MKFKDFKDFFKGVATLYQGSNWLAVLRAEYRGHEGISAKNTSLHKAEQNNIRVSGNDFKILWVGR